MKLITCRDTHLNAQKGEIDFVKALRSQTRWLSFGNEVNPFERYHPLRPIMRWWNEHRMVRYIFNELNLRFRNNLEKDELAKDAPRKTIVDLALDNYQATREQDDLPNSIDKTFQDAAISQIRIFVFAGHDTTGSTICYMFHLLSLNPSARHLLTAEHDQVLGPDHDQVGAIISQNPHLLNSLHYTLAIVKETLRLYPPASSTRGGEPNHYITLPDGRQLPTEGYLVWSNAFSIHLDSKYWPDADKFLPERWLAEEGDRLYPLKGAYRPFEFGPRNCIGQELAMLELKLVLVMTAREFKITSAYDEWDRMHPSKGPKTVNGERAYQILAGSAHPCDGFPCRVSFAWVEGWLRTYASFAPSIFFCASLVCPSFAIA